MNPPQENFSEPFLGDATQVGYRRIAKHALRHNMVFHVQQTKVLGLKKLNP
jgi:hypothetical protein